MTQQAAETPVASGNCHLCGRNTYATQMYGNRKVCAADAIDYALNTEMHERALRERIRASVADMFGGLGGLGGGLGDLFGGGQ